VDGQEKGGGLAVFWVESIKQSVLSYVMHYIDTLIWDGEHHASWRDTFVCGEPHTQDRHVMWELLKRIKQIFKVPWMLIGDFNEAMWSFEHLSSRRRPERQMYEFREILSSVKCMIWASLEYPGHMIISKLEKETSKYDLIVW
jgi:hypothetical protein